MEKGLFSLLRWMIDKDWGVLGVDVVNKVDRIRNMRANESANGRKHVLRAWCSMEAILGCLIRKYEWKRSGGRL